MIGAAEEAEGLLDVLEQQLGPHDWRFGHVTDIYERLVADGLDESYWLGGLFLDWAAKHVERIGDEQLHECVCDDGWVAVTADTVRACSRCHRAAYDKRDESF